MSVTICHKTNPDFDFKTLFRWFIGKEVYTFYRFLPVLSVRNFGRVSHDKIGLAFDLMVPTINTISMNEELKLIQQKLDTLITKLDKIQSRLSFQEINSPPLSLQEAATYLHLSVSRVYSLVYAGRLQTLQHTKRGRHLFSKEHLNQYLYEK
ncbi:helix-turn-helix domain-containing protein [Niastella koreensis]|nr:helix-turn-helix domain-containing protein [Niastella koreensis]